MGSYVIAVSTSSSDSESDELQSLRQWLDDEGEFAGTVRAGAGRAVPGTLGTVSEVLLITLGPGGAAALFASVLIAWIRSRTGSVIAEVQRADGAKMKVEARGLSGLSPDRVQDVIRELSLWTETDAAAGDSGDGRQE